MSSTLSKQDRQGARTPADLERRHAFGRSFAEVAGIASDARTQAENASVATAAEVINAINTSAEVIEIKSNRLIVSSDHFLLSAEGDIEATRGKIGDWDISENGISKITDSSWVQITSPTSSSDTFLSVAHRVAGEVLSVPLAIKANGNIETTGIIKCTSTVSEQSTTIDDGTITIDGPISFIEEGNYMAKLLMQCLVGGSLYGLYAVFSMDESDVSYPVGITVEKIT